MTKRYVLVHDENKCIGCQACNVACRSENNVPESVTRIQVRIEGPYGNFPHLHFKYNRVSCEQCENAPCVKVCPTGAAYVNDDGIVSINEKKCVGCLYCVAACPYKVRFINPETRVPDKCDFCKETRLARGEEPACVTVCPTQALVFGDANDMTSEVRKVLDTKNHYQQKVNLGTEPRVYRIPSRKGGIKA
ncbi:MULTISPECIES: 4Fe-4S dicluster domain-containing protein [Shewanella]|uniref:4Fe-4S ferredoxin iron-sulfur binding domain protein n=1 Tax=Shewanella pealeana (strain ATCC 700345 / ANG-SQ1) TaxID=398579 RepID=A8H718_SHEPA|nr:MULTISPECIES: 4Fe-4S dicluster domain-containing protein [Shewanella]ABV88355.1 4Fe-4S ferredoxin iron-sulfur binding domain protein [Shewanella pealeana ATCC 700345]GIU13190.1 polysulfide reductase subunit B [Shewanella sp. MBTL60-112-B1]GIU27188.1 polysulfide reductase subunit B [Shewanella sp. MBTL60-112-B2]